MSEQTFDPRRGLESLPDAPETPDFDKNPSRMPPEQVKPATPLENGENQEDHKSV